MLQRIQTVWLLLAAAAAFLTLKLSFYSGNIMINNEKLFRHLSATMENVNILLTILSVAVGIAALIIIFMFKDRKMQMRLLIITIILSLLNIYLYFNESKKFVEGRLDWSCIFVFIIPIFLILAARGIYKDEKLIKSMDRLR
jgi:Domain of unknown function (DUF4293)